MKPRIILLALLTSLVACPSVAAVRRAVSLRVLQSTLKAGPSRQASQLCGITNVSGFLVDKKTRDIIIFGDVDPTRPPLQFDDFVVALRNAWFIYSKRSGNVRYYSPPGCSIDPQPDTLRQLQDVGNRLDGASDPTVRTATLEEWKTVGQQAQKVRVMGVPFDSRFAKVMVDADFYMKRLVNGSVTLGINGFKSLTEMSIDSAHKSMTTGKPVSIGQTLNRFWFCPGDTTFTDEDNVIILRSCPVRLLTEQEYLTRSGVQGYGRPDPMAHKFAQSFTARYRDIEAERPIYEELEGLFRLSALAKLIRSEGAEASGFQMHYLLTSYPVPTVPVNRAVTGITDIREIQENRKVADVQTTSLFWHLSCGGVSMDIRPRRVRVSKAKTIAKEPSAQPFKPAAKPVIAHGSAAKPGPMPSRPARPTNVAAKRPQTLPSKVAKVPSLRKAVLSARKSTKSLYWDVPAVE